jgi:DeoR family deoxyribose operon repressor
MTRAERLRRLEEAVHAGGALRYAEAAERLGCSAMTVRRDVASAPESLAALGGYVVKARARGAYAIERESDVNAAAKAAVAARAARLIADGDTIFLDCGTTTPHLARLLPPHMRLTVVCYALNVAAPLAINPNAQLILLGGLYNASSASFALEEPERALAGLGVVKAFISAGGVHAQRGVSCSSFHEAPVKRAAMRIALRRYLIVDASKLGLIKPAAFAEIDEFDAAIVAPKPVSGPEVERLGGRLLVG